MMMKMKCFNLIISLFVLIQIGNSQSPSFTVFNNPVIPGDHPDCTLTKIGNDYYTTGSSFLPTPVIYHSTNLVHWEAVAQPVRASWEKYGEKPKDGCWGGQVVFYENKYWFFFKNGPMRYATANKIEGPWSDPVTVVCPKSLPGLGYDNSIFIDDDGKWYLVIKNAKVNNWIVELGKDGQPSGAILDLRWLNPAPEFKYGVAEGPVIWKENGYYYYSFAINAGGGQKAMRSKTLTDVKEAWTEPIDIFDYNTKTPSYFRTPNHSSYPVKVADGTSWIITPIHYRQNGDWLGQGRQGILSQITYDSNNHVVADFPIVGPRPAPKASSSGIPWMVPKSDFFNDPTLHPEWSYMGYTPENTHSLTERSGWFKLSPRPLNNYNTIVKNDAEHNYSLITRLDFDAISITDEAGLQIISSTQKEYVKLSSTFNSTQKVVKFSFMDISFEVENKIGNVLWLKLNRVNHFITALMSADGENWVQVGQPIDIKKIDSFFDINTWTGSRQGIYVNGSTAFFDLYIYRDAYTPILAECPANMFGTDRSTPSKDINILENIHNNDWAMYAGVEFGNTEYQKSADSIKITASCDSKGGEIEIWLDSIGTGNKIGVCNITSTGGWSKFQTFSAKINKTTGRHDVYLKFTTATKDKFMQMKWLEFVAATSKTTSKSKKK